MNMRIERGGPFSYEFNPMELVVDTHEIYKKTLEIIKLETSGVQLDDLARLEELRRIKGYIGGYEQEYRIEGFDFVKFSPNAEIHLLNLLSPLPDQNESEPRLFPHELTYITFRDAPESREGVKGSFELKTHEFDDSGDEFVSEDFFYTLHPIVTPIWEPYKVERVKEALEENPDRELIDLS